MNGTAAVDYEPGLDIIVVNYKCPRDLAEFIQSLGEFAPEVPFNLYIVNIAPDYQSYDIGQKAKGFGISHTWRSANVGFARGVNLVAPLGNKEALAIFNADTKFTRPLLDECYEQLMSHDDWAVLGPKQLTEENLITSGGVIGTNESPQLRWWKQHDSSDKALIDDTCVSVSGSAYLIKRAMWDSIFQDPKYKKAHLEVLGEEATGAFPNFQHFYEEMACSLMVRNKGKKVVFYAPRPELSMIHHWHRSSPIGSEVDQNAPKVREQFRRLMGLMEIPHE